MANFQADQSIDLLSGELELQNDIQRALKEYEQKIDGLQELEECENQEFQNKNPPQVKYYGYQDKKSLTIKPLNMFHDVITLQKQNREKKATIRELQTTNLQLKDEYDRSVAQNEKIQHFLKDIEFTFKNDKKLQKSNEVMGKAKRQLFMEAKDTKDELKKILKSPQANTIQQYKAYVLVMEAEKSKLTKCIKQKKDEIAAKQQEHDFNDHQLQKFKQTCANILAMLQKQCHDATNLQENYKIERMLVTNQLKNKQIQHKNQQLDLLTVELKDLLLEQQGLEYSLEILHQRKKYKNKESESQNKLTQELANKEQVIVKYQKQLKEKSRTFDYMLEWTRELKKKLEDRKNEHLSAKTKIQAQISKLGEEYEDWNRLYKAELMEEQVLLKKKITGTKQQEEILKQSQKTAHIRTIKFEEIRILARRIALHVVCQKRDLNQFISSVLLNKNKKRKQVATSSNKKVLNRNNSSLTVTDLTKSIFFKSHSKNTMAPLLAKKSSLRTESLFQTPQSKNSTANYSNANISCTNNSSIITLQELTENIQSLQMVSASSSPNEAIKLARYIVEDNNLAYSKIELNSIIELNLASIIFRNLLTMHIKQSDMQTTNSQIKGLILLHFDSIRHDLKIGSDREEKFDVGILNQILFKYINEEEKSLRFTEFIEVRIWCKFQQCCQLAIWMFDIVCQEIVEKKLVKDCHRKKIPTGGEEVKLNQGRVFVETPPVAPAFIVNKTNIEEDEHQNLTIQDRFLDF